MDKELLPCPFCGNKPVTQDNHAGGFWVYCSNVGCVLDDLACSIKEWQIRTPAKEVK